MATKKTAAQTDTFDTEAEAETDLVQEHLDRARELLEESHGANGHHEKLLLLNEASVNANIAQAEAMRAWYATQE